MNVNWMERGWKEKTIPKSEKRNILEDCLKRFISSNPMNWIEQFDE